MSATVMVIAGLNGSLGRMMARSLAATDDHLALSAQSLSKGKTIMEMVQFLLSLTSTRRSARGSKFDGTRKIEAQSDGTGSAVRERRSYHPLRKVITCWRGRAAAKQRRRHQPLDFKIRFQNASVFSFYGALARKWV